MSSSFNYMGQTYDISYFKTLLTSADTGQINYDSLNQAIKEGSISQSAVTDALAAGYISADLLEGYTAPVDRSLSWSSPDSSSTGGTLQTATETTPTTTLPSTSPTSTPTTSTEAPNATQPTSETQTLGGMTQQALQEIANYNPTTAPQQNALNRSSVIMSQDASNVVGGMQTTSAQNVQQATNTLNQSMQGLTTGKNPMDIYGQMQSLTGKRKKIGTQETKVSQGTNEALLAKPTLLGL